VVAVDDDSVVGLGDHRAVPVCSDHVVDALLESRVKGETRRRPLDFPPSEPTAASTARTWCELAETRVDELVASERANPFAPAGRRFREWAAIPEGRSRSWKRLLDEALEFAIAHPAPAKKR
jgi:hypothetical protein